jgi:hypothetical protein
MNEETVGAVGAVTETQNNVEEVSTAKTETVGEGAPQTTANDGEQEQGKRKGGWQRKIEKQERLIETLIEQLAHKGGSQVEKEPVKVEAKEEPFVFSKQKPKPEDFRIQDTETFDQTAYLEAVADWKVDEREAKAEHKRVQESKQQEQQKEKSKEAEKLKAWRERNAEAVKSYPDYEEVITSTDLSITPVMSAAIEESEVGAHLAYYLATHEDEAKAIAAMSAWNQSRALSKIEAQFAKEEPAAKSEDETPEPPVSKAPKPITPVKRPSAADKPIDPRSPDSDKIPADEWLKLRLAQERKRK